MKTLTIIFSAILLSNAFGGPYDPYAGVTDKSPIAIRAGADFYYRHGYLPAYAYGNGTSPYAEPKKKNVPSKSAAELKAARVAAAQKAKQQRMEFYKAQKGK